MRKGTLLKLLACMLIFQTFGATNQAFASWQETETGNREWQYIQADGTVAKGRFIDPDDGNIYYLDDTTGIMKRNYQSNTGEYFGPDGAADNYTEISEELDKSVSEAIALKNVTLWFGSKDSISKWQDYYDIYFSDFGHLANRKFLIYGSNNFSYTPTLYSSSSSSVREMLDQIKSQVTGETIKEKVLSASRAVGDYFTYAYDRDPQLWSNMDLNANTKQAVCMGYSETLARALKELGIDAEYVRGTAASGSHGTGNHAWVRVDLNQGTGQGQKWLYTDPTWYSTLTTPEQKEAFLEISYDNYLKNYYMWGVRSNG